MSPWGAAGACVPDLLCGCYPNTKNKFNNVWPRSTRVLNNESGVKVAGMLGRTAFVLVTCM